MGHIKKAFQIVRDTAVTQPKSLEVIREPSYLNTSISCQLRRWCRKSAFYCTFR